MNVEYNKIHFSPIKKNRNYDPSEDNNCSDDYSMVFLYDGHMCDTIIYDNTDPSSNNNLECRDLVLSYLHIGDKKYRIL